MPFISGYQHLLAQFKWVGSHYFGQNNILREAVRFWELHGYFLFYKERIGESKNRPRESRNENASPHKPHPLDGYRKVAL